MMFSNKLTVTTNHNLKTACVHSTADGMYLIICKAIYSKSSSGHCIMVLNTVLTLKQKMFNSMIQMTYFITPFNPVLPELNHLPLVLGCMT